MDNKLCNYQIQCPVIFGVDAVETLAGEVKKMGKSKAFVVYDQGVKATGIGDRVMQILADGGVEAKSFDNIAGEPIAHIVNEAGEQAREFGAEVVIGVGGGAPLDTAKLVAVLLTNPGKIEDYFLSLIPVKGPEPIFATMHNHAPLIGVTTASGTGAEVTCVAVLARDDGNKDAAFSACDLAIVDPKLTVTAPPHVTANSGFDAMAHALEAYTTGAFDPVTGQGNDPFSKLLAIRAIEIITDNIFKVYDDGSDLEARTEMSKAANWAGIAFSNTGVSFGHCIAHEFGSSFHVPHGLACSWTVPATVYHNALWEKETGLAIAKAMRVDVTEKNTEQEIADALKAKAIAMLKYCHIPNISTRGFTKEEAMDCYKKAIEGHPDQFANTIVPLTEEEFRDIIGEIYDYADALDE